MKASLTPASLPQPFGNYSHGILAEGQRILFTSGQLGMRDGNFIPRTAEEQTELCFAYIDAILAEGGMTRANVVRINAFVTDRQHMRHYMKVRDTWIGETSAPPASTLVVVSGFTREEFLVEVEVTAVG